MGSPMKKFRFKLNNYKLPLLTPALAFGLAFSATATAAGPTVNVATDPSFVPFEMLDPDTGEMVGFDMDIINAVDRKSTRLNSSHVAISYAVFCLKKKTREKKTNG